VGNAERCIRFAFDCVLPATLGGSSRRGGLGSSGLLLLLRSLPNKRAPLVNARGLCGFEDSFISNLEEICLMTGAGEISMGSQSEGKER
jgi:hypothetical protein